MNDTDALLHVVMGSHPVPQPKWEYGVTRGHIRKLQPCLMSSSGCYEAD
jgi:hypothetical protein